MAQTQGLKRRIRSVKNAGQITKALEVVAASRMRKIVGLVDGSRTYGELATGIIQRVAQNPEVKELPFFGTVTDKPTLYVVFTSDRGQAGAYNSNVFNLVLSFLRQDKYPSQVLVYGRKGARFFARLNNVELRGTFEDLVDVPEVNVFASAMEIINQEVASGTVGKVIIIYTQFLSPLTQKASSFKLMPIASTTEAETTSVETVYELEPDTADVIDESIRLYLEAKLMQARVESVASEHAMRMMAMGNASRNAKDLVDGLTLDLNTIRQAAITQEIAEITGGAAAIAT